MSERTLNTYYQLLAAREAGLPDVAIVPATFPGSRGDSHVYGWQVYRPGKRVLGARNTSNPWESDYNCRVFADWDEKDAPTRRDQRKAALARAKAWAGERYGVTEWKRNRMRDYVDAQVNKQFPIPKR